MRKQTRTLIITGVAVVALGGVLAGLLLFPPKEEGTSSGESSTANPTVTVLDKSKDAEKKDVEKPVKAITFRLEKEEFSLALNSEKILVVEKYKTLPVSAYATDSLADSLAVIQATQKIENPGNAADFGLDKPKATVAVTYHDDSQSTLEIGSETPLKTGYYLRLAGEPAIYVISTSLAESLTRASTAYIGTELIVAPTVKEGDKTAQAIMRDMELSGSVRTPFAFRRVTEKDASDFSYSTYRFTSPYARGLNSNTVQPLEAFTQLSATAAVVPNPTKADLDKYGLSKPYSVAKISVAVMHTADDPNASSAAGDTTKAQLITFTDISQHTITLGNKDPDGNYYATVNAIPVIYTLSPSSVAFATLQYDDLADTMLFMKDITSVESIAVKTADTNVTFQLAHHPEKEERDETLTVTADGKTYKTDDFRGLYQVMMGVARNSAATGKPAGTPILTLTVKPLSGKGNEVVAQIYENTASLSQVVLNTGETYLVKASDVVKLTKQLDNYLAGKPVLTN